MNGVSTREAAKKLGISPIALSRYIAKGKVPAPALITLGRSKVHVWTEAEIEHVRQLLPKIANGRKTRHKKKQSAVSNQQSAKTKRKTQARVPAPHKKK
jgi:predicted DNA-binding transcriptional regulator AlpA